MAQEITVANRNASHPTTDFEKLKQMEPNLGKDKNGGWSCSGK
jgi:hypothetical protein